MGRITAQVDRDFNDHQGHGWGIFGFFECDDDQEAAAPCWRAAGAGCGSATADRTVGPFDFTMNDEAGVLIEGFERKPRSSSRGSTPTTRTCSRAPGLAKAIDLYMWDLQVDKRSDVAPMIWKVAEAAEKQHGVTLRQDAQEGARQEIHAFIDIYNAAWKDNWGFTPMRDDDFQHTAKEMSRS